MRSMAAGSSSNGKEKTMPIESIIVSALVVTVFSTFGIALAYAERQTRNLKGGTERAGRSPETEQRWQEAA